MKSMTFVMAIALAASPAAFAHDAGLSDAQIAAIVVTANQVDIDAGQLAKTKGSTADVKGFAQQMITDHGGVNQKAKALVAKLHVTPAPSDTSAALQKGGDENLAALKTLSGPAFDRAYVDHEVAYHQQVIDALDKTLIPSAQNKELEDLLVSVRPAFVAHLDHAKHLQSALAK